MGRICMTFLCHPNCKQLRGLTHRQQQKIVIWMIIPKKNNSNDDFFFFLARVVSKLESLMLITITNSNSSPEVNSSEVSLKSQCKCSCVYAKTSKSSFGRRSLRDLCVLCTHVFIYKILPPLENSHSKDELQSSFKLRIFSRV